MKPGGSRVSQELQVTRTKISETGGCQKNGLKRCGYAKSKKGERAGVLSRVQHAPKEKKLERKNGRKSLTQQISSRQHSDSAEKEKGQDCVEQKQQLKS